MSQLNKVFARNRKGLNLRRGVMLATVLAARVAVFGALHREQYRLSVNLCLPSPLQKRRAKAAPAAS